MKTEEGRGDWEGIVLFYNSKKEGGRGMVEGDECMQMYPDSEDANMSVSTHKHEELDGESTSAMCAPCLVYRDDIKTNTRQ